MADREGNVLKVPGTSAKTEVKGTEILASYARFTQKGVTIASGSGVLEAGTLLGRVTATKKYAPYDNDVSTGVEVARGFLRTGVDATSTDVLGNLVVSGIVKALQCAVASGFSTVDNSDYVSAAVDLNGRIDADKDLFIF